MGVLETANRRQRRLEELDLDHILAVQGKRVAHLETAACPEWQPVAVNVLRHVAANSVGVCTGSDSRVSNRKCTDLPRRGQIVLEEGGRNAEHVGVVVEAAARVVLRQKSRGVDVKRQQVANGVCVLGPIEPMERRSPGIGLDGRCVVEGCFEPVHKSVQGRRIGPWSAHRRHRTYAELAHHSFPQFPFVRNLVEIK